jgi:hypothetical protein
MEKRAGMFAEIKRQMKIEIILWPDIPERKSVVNSENPNDRYLIDVDGQLWENYGNAEKQNFLPCFDTDYEIIYTNGD